MEIGILGPLTVTRDGRPLRVNGPLPRALLVALALDAGEVVPGGRLVDALWGSSPPADPANALQAVASRLRRALGAGQPDGGDLLLARGSGYLLAVDRDAVDAHRFERLAAQGGAALAAGAPDRAAATLGEALAIWRGPVLADLAADPFTQGHVTRLAELRLAATEDRAEAELALATAPPAGPDPAGPGAAQARLARLAAELEVLAAEHPLRERLQALLMRALYGAGRQADALAAHRRARRALADLGLDPGPELRRLERALLAQDPALAVPPPPRPATPDPAAAGRGPAPRRRGNLPEPLTSFVGRDEALTQVLGLLQGSRLVTLTGPGGAGKTRLALEAARRRLAAGADPDGAWLVELAALRDPSRLASEAVAALGAHTGPAAPGRQAEASWAPAPDATGRLLEFLEHKRLLLVLDNCEHLVEAAATLVGRVLAACPGVRVLATSRERLRLTGETRWPVPALAVPPPGADPDAVAGYGAVRLFAERAAAAAPGFAVDRANAAAVAEVCRRLDGLPLAIELAAARVGTLGVELLAARLDDRFRLLTGGSRTALPRQQTLHGVVGWSWELLDQRERVALARLSGFAGGCTLDAAEQVIAGPGLEPGEVLEVIGNLVDKSLLATGPGPDREAGPRYHLLETVRAYAAERLAELGPDAADQTARAHADWCAALAERSVPGLRGPEQMAWTRRLEAERENLRAALAWSVAGGDAERALRLAGNLGWFWWQRGHRDEARAWLGRALALEGGSPGRRGLAHLYGALTTDLEDPASVERMREHLRRAEELLAAAGDTANRVLARLALGTFGARDQEALATIEDCLGLLGSDGDPWDLAVLRLFRAMVLVRLGRVDEGRQETESSLATFRSVGDRWGRIQALVGLASVAELRGRYDQGLALLDEAIEAAEDMGLREIGMMLLVQRGNLEMLLGRYEAAAASQAVALEAATELGSAGGLAFAHNGAGLVAQRVGDLDRAHDEHQAALAIYRRIHMPNGLAVTLAWLGFVAERRGDAAAAAALHGQALEAARQTGDPRAQALAVEGLAGAAAAGGDPERAGLLLGAAAALRASVNAPLPPAERFDVDRIEAAARAALGGARFAQAAARGAGLPPDQLDGLIEARAGLAGGGPRSRT